MNEELRMRLADRVLLCCGEHRTGELVTEERVYNNGVILVDAPLLRCPACGTEHRDVFLGALLEQAVVGLAPGPITVATLTTLLEGPWDEGEPTRS